MGVSTNICLPSDVRIRDVRTAVGILAGAEKVKRPLGGTHRDSWSAETKDRDFVKFDVDANNPSCVQIILKGEQIDGERHMGHYRFEPEQTGTRQLSTGCSPFWQAIGVRLVQLFGGSIDLNDCDGIDCDYVCERPRATNSPHNGKAWQDLEQALYDLKPITKKDLKRDWKKWASELSVKAALEATPAAPAVHEDVRDDEWMHYVADGG